jgi:hypothetical protein
MPSDGMGQEMLGHFLSGSADPVNIDLNAELAKNPDLTEHVVSNIQFDLVARMGNGDELTSSYGSVWVSQGDYGTSSADARDQTLGMGGTFIEYDINGTADDGGLMVNVYIGDTYFWSPSDDRPGQCMHECATDMVAEGTAYEFAQVGEGQLFVSDPHTSSVTMPAAETETESDDPK